MSKRKWKCRFCAHEWRSCAARRNRRALAGSTKRAKAPVMCPKCKRRNWREDMSQNEREVLRRQMREQKAKGRRRPRAAP